MLANEPLYDLSPIIRISKGNDLFVRKMVSVFCTEGGEMLQKMLDAHQFGNIEEMGDMAHKLKPLVDNLRIFSLKQPVRDIEKIGLGERGAGDLNQLLTTVQNTMLDIIAELKKEYPTQ